MNGLMSGIMATSIVTSLAAASATPAMAVPAFHPEGPKATTMVEQVQYDRRYHVTRRGDGYYMNGHRGYRDYRPGYRQYDDFWFPAGAFVAGALIGSALNQPRYAEPRYSATTRYGNSHVQWCYDRYRSYRASDNSFQPYNGPRQQCYSPYG